MYILFNSFAKSAAGLLIMQLGSCLFLLTKRQMGPWWPIFLPGKQSDGEPRGVGSLLLISKCQFGTWPPAESHCKDASIRHPSFYILCMNCDKPPGHKSGFVQRPTSGLLQGLFQNLVTHTRIPHY